MEIKDVYVKLDKNQAEEKESSLFRVAKRTLERYYGMKESVVKGVYVIKASNVSFLNVPPKVQEELDKPDGIIKLISKEEYINLLPVRQLIMTKREKHLLWMILHRSMSRYILVNMPGREYEERADLHIFISKVLCHYILMDGGIWTFIGLDDEYPKGLWEVHDWIAEHITDRMDEAIGFIIGREMTHEEQKQCTKKFFGLLCDSINEIAKVINQSESTNLHNG